MKIFETLSSWQNERLAISPGKTLGFVPTMGNLHQGHLRLIEQAKQQNDFVVVSIFVNPTQFNQQNDFIHYPRTMEQDIKALQQAGVDYLLLPSEHEIYPHGFHYVVQCDLPIATVLEGEKRPGHFAGMLTVVLKLLVLANAHQAYFGEKDFQQLQLVKGLAQEFYLPTEIIGVAIERESSGLALSSRNNRLTAQGKKQAENFAKIFTQQTSLEVIRTQLQQNNIEVEYLEEFAGRRYIAVLIDGVRLIDNIQE